MEFATPLVPARLIRRYKRFLADAELPDGRCITAHCPNPGAMTGLADPGMRIWLEPNDDPRRKLRFGWRLSELASGVQVCIDTGQANRVVGEALRAGRITGLRGDIRAERPMGRASRVDFRVGDSFLEVKSVTLSRQPGLAEFPDCQTKRGLKHLHDLGAVARAGGHAAMLYLVMRGDCDRFAVAEDLDPAYAQGFARARDAGVGMLCFAARVGPDGVHPGPALPIWG